jgi:ectoine hydroxylase-related dioxygenase (phytanoyl-CoA dioxygenase family)
MELGVRRMNTLPTSGSEAALEFEALEAARRDYERDGACCLRSVVSAAWINELRDALGQSAASPTALSKTWRSQDGRERFFQDVFVWRSQPALRRFALESGVAGAVASLLRSKALRLYSDHVFLRDTGTAKETPWHQDESYCFVSGQQFCGVWMPLDPIRREECLRLVRGSHAWGVLYLPVEFASRADYPDLSARGQRIPEIQPKEHEILAWDMQPGDCIVFSGRMLHGSPSTPPADGPRRVYVTRWIGDDARYHRPGWSVPPLPCDPGLADGDAFSGELFPVAHRSGERHFF